MHGATVLVVEDEQVVALDLTRRLTALGYSVTSVSSGEEALERTQTLGPDLILMDIKLGGIDGIEVARRIRKTQDIPIVFLTAFSDETTLERARGVEPYGYLMKPFDVRELEATIEMALERHGSDLRQRERESLQHFLADASAHLASSLDYRGVVQVAEELIVPRHADWCRVSISQTQDCSSPGRLVETVCREGRSQLIATAPDKAALVELLGDDAIKELGERGLETQSLVCVPLFGRSKTIGSLLLVGGPTRRQYRRSDLEPVEDLAHRIGMAIDNALLFREAQEATRMRENILAVVAHDLRTPLTSILTRAELLCREPAPIKSAESIVRAARQMEHLISDLVDSASIDAGRLMLDRRPCRAGQLVLDAVEMARPIASDKSVALFPRVLDDQAQVLCDKKRVLQVLLNLLGNGIKFTPESGSLTVSVEPRGKEAQFSVRDTGPGIAAEHRAHLFERFWRGDAGKPGAGLGLFITKGIVEAHGGRIWVESKVGVGSTFCFTLPRSQ